MAAGHSVVQDRSQGVVLDLTGARPGELVLDLCAAPGGKALALVDRGCRVVAADAAFDEAVRAVCADLAAQLLTDADDGIL